MADPRPPSDAGISQETAFEWTAKIVRLTEEGEALCIRVEELEAENERLRLASMAAGREPMSPTENPDPRPPSDAIRSLRDAIEDQLWGADEPEVKARRVCAVIESYLARTGCIHAEDKWVDTFRFLSEPRSDV